MGVWQQLWLGWRLVEAEYTVHSFLQDQDEGSLWETLSEFTPLHGFLLFPVLLSPLLFLFPGGFPWKHFVNKSLKLESYSQVCFWEVNWDNPSPKKLQVWALINRFHEKTWSWILMDTSIRRIKKIDRKEGKERKCLWFYSVGYRHETFFFLSNRCFQLCSIKFLFFSLSNILDSCQCSV